MKKNLLVALALTGLFVSSTTRAEVITENFSANPPQSGWRIFGNPDLFQWNSTNQNLEVTWDSTQTNSYFYRPLGTILARDDDFSLSFDLQLRDAVAFNYGAELAVGLFRFASATNISFSRGGGSAPNLFEFDYFPDTGFGDSMDATMVDTNGDYGHLFFIYDNKTLEPGVTYQITLTHAAGTTNLTAQILTNGGLFTAFPKVFQAPITDFRLDTISISSYQDDGFGDSVLAHGTVDNFVVTVPPPPVQNLTGGFSNAVWQAGFIGRSNWLYTLERTGDFQSWAGVSATVTSNAANLFLQDTNPPANRAFYRVRAERP
jgi:hypothetical protein